ncbi:hypothetical protein [Crocinitomix algicola]|uniref:hypothetical protein n=1 Tax=Crocinitomix algicola TaxID=1740263 RepID=UPI0008363E4E|nr:hypothetical protein [Crocinitomix algicola]
MRYFLHFLTFLVVVSCQTEVHSTGFEETKLEPSITINEPISEEFGRSAIKKRIALKKANNEPLIVHGYIPLCDNEHQGIVPTSESLGNGLSLRTNLYWATSGGTKAYFAKARDWELVYNQLDLDTNVLERVVFKKNYPESTVYFIADAYRGDRMEETMNDYLAAIAGHRSQQVNLPSHKTLNVADEADLIIFNGHNGVMDYIDIKPWINNTSKRTDVVMNACVSYGYLQEELMLAGGYPLVRTNSLLFPGAYVLEQIIDDWVNDIDPVQLCLNAGRAYCKKHDCGVGTKVYISGW